MFLVFLVQIVYGQKDCRHSDYESQIIDAYPELAARFQSQQALSAVKAKSSSTDQAAAVPELITIPVVVHILYNKAEQNLSTEQVMSQVEALNRDFRGKNEDRKKAPSWFSAVAADCGIEFQLARFDPTGLPTTGIIRKPTSIQYFGLDDRVKSSSRGGDNAWDPNQYLNIWVCNLAGGVLGYSSTPGGPAEKDGVVISSYAFGTKGNGNHSFDMGRTTTHEIGHWLNLRHLWGDTYCGDDNVDDTPKQRNSNKGCPSGKKFSCGSEDNGDMYMNFMDLTDDRCMFMFSNGQKQRMRALFEKGEARHALLSSRALAAVELPPAAEIPAQVPAVSTQKVAVHIYPNPVSNALSIKFKEVKEAHAKIEVVIYSHTGKPELKEIITAEGKTIDISHLKPGLYYLHIGDGSTKTIKKFMKL